MAALRTLSLINNPRIVGRSDHKASFGPGKLLARKSGAPFQLLPWHEIFLDITPPPEAEMESGTRLSGLVRCTLPTAYPDQARTAGEVRAHYRGRQRSE